jgi:hypothetical protein
MLTYSGRFQPCNPDAEFSACCALNGTDGQNDICMDSGLCMSTSGWFPTYLWANGCTGTLMRLACGALPNDPWQMRLAKPKHAPSNAVSVCTINRVMEDCVDNIEQCHPDTHSTFFSVMPIMVLSAVGQAATRYQTRSPDCSPS